jgi:hypothetical protein
MTQLQFIDLYTHIYIYIYQSFSIINGGVTFSYNLSWIGNYTKFSELWESIEGLRITWDHILVEGLGAVLCL